MPGVAFCVRKAYAYRPSGRCPERIADVTNGTDSLSLHGEADDDVLADLRRLFPSLFAAVMAAGDDEGDDDLDDDDADNDDEDLDDEDDDTDDDEDDEDEDDAKGRRRKPRRKTAAERRLQDENARRRVTAKRLREERDEARAELARLKKSAKTENGEKPEKDDGGDKELREQLDKANARLAKFDRKKAVEELADEYKITDARLLGALLTEEDVDRDEDGEWPDKIGTIVRRLKKRYPNLVTKASEGEDDEDEEDEDDGKGRRRRPTVSSTGKGRRRTKKVDEKALVNRYPALAGRNSR